MALRSDLIDALEKAVRFSFLYSVGPILLILHRFLHLSGVFSWQVLIGSDLSLTVIQVSSKTLSFDQLLLGSEVLVHWDHSFYEWKNTDFLT